MSLDQANINPPDGIAWEVKPMPALYNLLDDVDLETWMEDVSTWLSHDGEPVSNLLILE